MLAGLLAATGRTAPADPPAAPAPPGDAPQALDEAFHGAVIGLKGTTVRLRYDFSDPAQAKDWTETVPWPIAKDAGDKIAVSDGRLSVRGSVGAQHVAEWEGDVSLTFRLIPDGVKDIGGFLDDPDTNDDYATFSIGETYFHNWDAKTGGDTGMMKFGKQWGSKGFPIGFRYMTQRRPPTDPVPGKPIAFAFGRKGGKDFLNMDDLSMEAAEPGNRMKLVTPGLYAIKSSMTVDDLVIEGTLAPSWLEKHRVALRTVKPIPVDAPAATPIDPAVQAMIAAYQKGGTASPTELVGVVCDAARSDGDRQAAAAALKAGPHRALPAFADVLGNADASIRAVGLDLVKSMTGKTYGYEPRAGEKARREAVQRFLKDLDDHPDLLKGSGVK
jgi:hypothetical protein